MAMTLRENSLAILRYENYEKLPIVNFGYWGETLQKWVQEGHLTQDEIQNAGDGSENDRRIGRKLGFDFNWYSCFGGSCGIQPPFEQKVLEVREDGSKIMVDSNGVIVKVKDDIVSIPSEIDHMLKDRESWERDFKHRLQYSESRINLDALAKIPRPKERETPLGIHCGSLFGEIRNILGVEGTSYVYCDDEELYDEIIDTVGELCYKVVKRILESGVQFDFGHFWEDICFKNGPLVIPSVFAEKVGPHYKKITELLREYAIDIVSLDCDGQIDALIPIWLENGVNTMFPIEVGTWGASIAPWREKYGNAIRGVGGMNKTVFAQDYAAVDREVERLKPLVALGGYIPCMDHRIPPDAKWENVQYYCEQMRKAFQ